MNFLPISVDLIGNPPPSFQFVQTKNGAPKAIPASIIKSSFQSSSRSKSVQFLDQAKVRICSDMIVDGIVSNSRIFQFLQLNKAVDGKLPRGDSARAGVESRDPDDVKEIRILKTIRIPEMSSKDIQKHKSRLESKLKYVFKNRSDNFKSIVEYYLKAYKRELDRRPI